MPEIPLERRVRELESELFTARETVINLLEPEVRRIFEGRFQHDSLADASRWFKRAIERVLDLAVPQTGVERGDVSYPWPRARCPLCGGSANDFHSPNNGFAFPEGLLRHLLGANHAHQCEVAREVLAQARYCGRPREEGVQHPNWL